MAAPDTTEGNDQAHSGHCPAFQKQASLPEQVSHHTAARWLRTGAADRALDAFNELLSRSPSDARSLHGRGLALHALGQTEEALRAFRAASIADPKAWAPVASIADITPDETERTCALNRHADILVCRCTDASAGADLFNRAAGALADAHRHVDLALFAQRYKARFKDAARAYDWRARASYELGEFSEALAWKRAALRLTQVERASVPPPLAFEPETALHALIDLSAVLEQAGLAFFLAAGTALGMIRSGGPLSHDRDIDIGVFREHAAGPDIAAILRTHPRLMLARGARPGDRYFALRHKGIAFDIFVHDKAGAGITCGFSDRPGDIQWRFSRFSLRPCTSAGRTWLLPHPIDRYLAESYGPDWRVPDKGFASAISSPSLCGVDIRVRAFYAAARARAALLAGNISKARALVRQSPLVLALPPGTENAEN